MKYGSYWCDTTGVTGLIDCSKLESCEPKAKQSLPTLDDPALVMQTRTSRYYPLQWRLVLTAVFQSDAEHIAVNEIDFSYQVARFQRPRACRVAIKGRCLMMAWSSRTAVCPELTPAPHGTIALFPPYLVCVIVALLMVSEPRGPCTVPQSK